MKKGRGSRDFVFPQISGRFPVSAKAWESEEVFGFRSAAKKVGSRHQIPNPTQQQQGETQNLARAVKTWKYRPPPSPQCKCLQIIPLSRTNGRVQWQAYKREQMPSVISIRFIQSISSSSSCKLGFQCKMLFLVIQSTYFIIDIKFLKWTGDVCLPKSMPGLLLGLWPIHSDSFPTMQIRPSHRPDLQQQLMSNFLTHF